MGFTLCSSLRVDVRGVGGQGAKLIDKLVFQRILEKDFRPDLDVQRCFQHGDQFRAAQGAQALIGQRDVRVDLIDIGQLGKKVPHQGVDVFAGKGFFRGPAFVFPPSGAQGGVRRVKLEVIVQRGGAFPVKGDFQGSDLLAQRCVNSLDDEMRVAAAKTETADADEGLMVDPGWLGNHADLAGFKVDVRVGLVKMQIGGDDDVVEAGQRFDQPGDTRGGFQMTDIGLDRADVAHIPSVLGDGVVNGRNLDGSPSLVPVP